MNLLICDDEPAVVEQVSALLRDHCEKSGISAHFYPFSDPGAIKDLSSYDIAFLDIDMGDSSGIDLARTLRRETPESLSSFSQTLSNTLRKGLRYRHSGIF